MYGKVDYWAERYAKDPEPYDWYNRYAKLRSIISHACARDAPVLVPGCGNSRLSEDMVDDGYDGGIANIDISRTVIDAQVERLKGRVGLTCAFRGGGGIGGLRVGVWVVQATLLRQ